jgi:hypothetical protein
MFRKPNPPDPRRQLSDTLDAAITAALQAKIDQRSIANQLDKCSENLRAAWACTAAW